MDAYAALVEHKATVRAVGVSFRPQATADGKVLEVGTAIQAIPQPGNPYDAKAIALVIGGQHVGFVPRGFSERIAEDPRLAGRVLFGVVSDIRLMPQSAIECYEVTTDKGVIHVTDRVATIPLDVNPTSVKVLASTDRGMVAASGMSVQRSGDALTLFWQAPVAGFDFTINSVGDAGVLPYSEQVA